MRTSAPGGSDATSMSPGRSTTLQGLALNWSLHPTLASANVPVAAVSAVDEYDFWARGVWGDVEQRMLEAIGTFPPVPDPAASKVAEVTQQVATLRSQLLPFADGNWGRR